MKAALPLMTAIALLTFAAAPAKSQNSQTSTAPQFLSDAADPNSAKAPTSALAAPAREGRRAEGVQGPLPTTTAEKGANAVRR